MPVSGLHPAANQKLPEGLRPGSTHIQPSEHILAEAGEWQELASAQGAAPHGQAAAPSRTPAGEPRAQRKSRGRRRSAPRPGGSTCRGSPASGSEDKVRYLPPRDSGTGHQASGARRARPRARLRPGSTPGSDARRGPRRPPCSLTIVVDPGRLQELHCSATAGLRREPRPSTRAGHGAAAAAFSHAARPPAAARPAPSVPPRHRRLAPQAAATAAPRARPPPLPPQPHPLRRSSSGSSRATPEVTARTCQIAPAGNRSLCADGAALAPPRGGAAPGGSALGPARAQRWVKRVWDGGGQAGPRVAAQAGGATQAQSSAGPPLQLYIAGYRSD